MQEWSTASALKWIQEQKVAEMSPYVYTYPPKQAYSPVTSEEDMASVWKGYVGPLNIYIHVPFCEMKCGFCNLFTVQSGQSVGMDRYLEALHRELALIDEQLERPVEIRSIHFGGGTPSLLSGHQIQGILGDITSRFKLSSDAEIAIEGTPSSLSEKKLKEFHEVGVTRMSIGIQSFDEAELDGMGRGQERGLGRRRLEAALQAGFANVNVDLIYGLPHQSEALFVENLEQVVELGPSSITLYPLVLRSRTAFGSQFRKSAEGFLSAQALYKAYDRATEILFTAQYEQRTLVLFARGGGGNKFEEEEFMGVPTLGIGAGARSYSPSRHYTIDNYFEPTASKKLLRAYVESIESGKVPARCSVILKEHDQARREAILQLLYTGVEKAKFHARFGVSFEELFSEQTEALKLEGMLVEDEQMLRFTAQGMKHSSMLAPLFYRPGILLEEGGYS